ncbi:MAG: single-stranded-DNA-specific exonuclease RecJ [Dehalococcoidales bacterium]|nr:single-stranded-DNA-specific exonuclease RecJ [Dehalococcoidales bacterium]
MSRCRWNLLPPPPDNYLNGVSGFPRLITQLFYHRGIAGPAEIEAFITADKRLSGDPFLLPDIGPAIARIYRALLSGEGIAVYGDFDVDGITGTGLLVQGLSALGGKVTPYIPHRLTEGYGLKTTALENLQQQGISLVVTVDCGITAVAEVKRARRKRLDIIITDHHTVPEAMPPAVAVVNPRRNDSRYPFPELAGVGVALKLLQALFQSVGQPQTLDGLADLVALGTVADMVPLVGENRYLVKRGLEQLNTAPRLGVREIAARTGLVAGHLDTDSICWILAPRLNAAGRLAHAMSSYRLLLTDSPPEAQELAQWLEERNAERQNLTSTFSHKAREQIVSQGITPLLVVTEAECPAGIAGLVASRLVEEFYRPAIVIKTGEVLSSGSCRSIPEFNIIAALNQCRELFSQFGGHAQAAGFSLPTRNVPRLRQTLLQLASTQLDGLDLRPCIDIDSEVRLSDFRGDIFRTIQQLAPFGQGNPAPTFVSHGIEVVDRRTMGGNSEHLRLKLRQDGVIWDGVGFGLGSTLTATSSPIDIVYNLELDRWNGRESLRLNILDFQ